MRCCTCVQWSFARFRVSLLELQPSFLARRLCILLMYGNLHLRCNKVIMLSTFSFWCGLNVVQHQRPLLSLGMLVEIAISPTKLQENQKSSSALWDPLWPDRSCFRCMR